MRILLASALALITACLDVEPVTSTLDQDITPYTVCSFALCYPGALGDQFCKAECGQTAFCQPSKQDNAGGICIFLTGTP